MTKIIISIFLQSYLSRSYFFFIMSSHAPLKITNLSGNSQVTNILGRRQVDQDLFAIDKQACVHVCVFVRGCKKVIEKRFRTQSIKMAEGNLTLRQAGTGLLLYKSAVSSYHVALIPTSRYLDEDKQGLLFTNRLS